MSENGKDNFKRYSIFVVVVLINLVLLFVASRLLNMRLMEQLADLVMLIIGLGDIVLIIITAVLMLRTSKRLEVAEHAKFKRDKKWYLILLKLFAVMLATWPIEIFSHFQIFNANALLTSDLIKLFSAIVLFNILLMRDEAREILYKKYRSLRTNYGA